MARLAQMGKTAVITFSNTSAGTFSAEVKTMDLAGPTREEIDVTHYGSGDYLEFEPAARADLQNITMDINFDTETYDIVVGLIGNTEIMDVAITFPLSAPGNTPEAVLEFQGYIAGLPLSLPATGGIEASVDFRVTAKYDFTPEGTQSTSALVIFDAADGFISAGTAIQRVDVGVVPSTPVAEHASLSFTGWDTSVVAVVDGDTVTYTAQYA